MKHRVGEFLREATCRASEARPRDATCDTNTAFSTLTEVEVALPAGSGGTPGSGDPVGNTFAGGG